MAWTPGVLGREPGPWQVFLHEAHPELGKTVARLEGGWCPERIGEGVWKVKAIPGEHGSGWSRVTAVVRVGRARSREDTQCQHGESKCRWVVIGEGRGPV